jgi:hypothetical protein
MPRPRPSRYGALYMGMDRRHLCALEIEGDRTIQVTRGQRLLMSECNGGSELTI